MKQVTALVKKLKVSVSELIRRAVKTLAEKEAV